MKRLKLVSLILVLIIVLGYLALDFFSYYPEVFAIKAVNIKLFSITDKGRDNVWDITQINSLPKDSTDLILAVKFIPEYISLKHEHPFINKPNAPRGAYGHIDAISSIKLNLLNDQETDIFKYAKNASDYRSFKADSIVKNIGDEHSSEGVGKDVYYVAQTPVNINELIKSYNSNKDAFNYIHQFKDYHFFLINSKFINHQNATLILKVEKANGEVISDTLQVR
jgi:hypothetical protein